MFDHLDDPNPPAPRELLVEIVVAEGARRRRRRTAIAGGAAAMLLVLAGGVRLAQAAGSDADVKTIPPQNDQDPSSDPSREGEGSGDELSTAPGAVDAVTTTAPPSGEASTPPGATTFAAITAGGLVVLADAGDNGAPFATLVDGAANDMQLGTRVALSPDRQTVYFDATPTTGDEAGESAIYKVSTTGGEPERLGTGTNPAVSPAGSETPRLAYVRNSAQIVIGNLDGENAQVFTGTESDESEVSDLAFTLDGKGLVYTAAPPDGPPSLHYLGLASMAAVGSTNDAVKLGPDDSAPAGTGWSSPDLRATDNQIVVVSTCCAPNATGATSLTVVNPERNQQPTREELEGVSGIVLQSSYDSSGQNQLVLTVEPDESKNLYLRQDGPLQRLDPGEQYKAIGW
jgi:hypothetical protein